MLLPAARPSHVVGTPARWACGRGLTSTPPVYGRVPWARLSELASQDLRTTCDQDEDPAPVPTPGDSSHVALLGDAAGGPVVQAVASRVSAAL